MNKLNIFIFAVVLLLVASTVEARRGGAGGGHQARSASQSNINRGGNRNNNVNRNNNINRNNNNININNNVNVNVNNKYNNNHHHGGCCYYRPYHPVATAAAITATAMIVGSIVNTLPVGCQTVIVNGFGYQQCGSTWYQPQISGSSTTYVVINDPH